MVDMRHKFSKKYSKITRKEEIMQLGGGVGRNKINATDQLLELRLVFEKKIMNADSQ